MAADDKDLVIRFLNMVRGSLDEKSMRLLEELRLKRLIVLARPAPEQAPEPAYDDPPPPKARASV